MQLEDRPDRVPEWDPKLLALFGKLVVEWGQLEMLLHQTCWTAAGLTEEQGRSVSAGQDWRSEWHFLETQITRHFPHLQEAAAFVRRRVDQAGAQHERVIHGVWMPGDPAGLRLLINCSADRTSTSEISGRQLMVLAVSVAAAREALAELHDRMQTGDNGGGAGVREPRRPYPPGGVDALSLPEEP